MLESELASMSAIARTEDERTEDERSESEVASEIGHSQSTERAKEHHTKYSNMVSSYISYYGLISGLTCRVHR